MKTRSIQFKFLLLVISAILAIAVLIGGFSIYEVDNYVNRHTEEFVGITCSDEAEKINNIFGSIEKSVRIMESYSLSLFESSEDVKNPEKQSEMLKLAGKMFSNVAVNTNGAVAYYLRFDPQISDGKTGIFYSKMDGLDEYVCLEPTDILLYDKNDTEHVGWFWQPYEAGVPVWLTPYYNQNNGILMISYVIPLYYEEQFIGVVGMDFDYTILTERIHEIKIYENGYAHLTLNDVVIHTGNEPGGDHSHDDPNEYFQVSEELVNGMSLVLSASYKDVRQIRYEIVYKILISVLLLTIIFSLIVFFVIKKAMKPLQKLTDASTKISKGDYNVEVVHGDTYEIQQLSLAFEAMLFNLREHEKLQHLLTYRDPLTNLRNTTSYKKWIVNFNEKIEDKSVSAFAIIMFDINCLKETNDTYGHDVGNELIMTASGIISDTFKRSPVFRIGGDEFVVILQNRDFEECDALLERFDMQCSDAYVQSKDTKIPVRIARGVAKFDPAKDTQFSDVFKRADDAMYKNKKDIKETK